jgi:multidrug efflux pump subunit AcrB
MNVLNWLLSNRRLVLTATALLSLTGAVLWMTMVRQEDPRLPDYWGQVVAPYPGADAPTVERLVLEPIEDALAEVSEIKLVEATAFEEVAVLKIELRGGIDDFTAAWDEVREALERARIDFPDGAGQPVLDENQVDQDAIVLGVTGRADLLDLLDGARMVKDALLRLPLVKRAHIIADPGEQVTIALDDATARRLGLNARTLAGQLNSRNRILPGGSLKLAGKSLRLRPLSEFASVEEIRNTPIQLPDGGSVPLKEVARVYLGPTEPAASRMRLDGEMAVGVAVVPREAINLVAFGNAVQAQVARLTDALQPLAIQTVTFQPSRTSARLGELNSALLFGVLIVAGLLVMTMGLRLGLVVAAVVPLVTMTSVAIYAWGGGVLHQISIAALVLALGMLVDNAIVMAENIQWRMDQGDEARQAALSSVRELATPLVAATLTTMAAFVPMLISSGPTADFTRTIPTIIILTLAVSYLYALLVTPTLSQMVLRPGSRGKQGRLERMGRGLAEFSIRRPAVVLTLAGAALAASVMLSKHVNQQFFPSADRNQILVDVKLTEGAHLDATDDAVRQVEKALLQRPEVTRVSSFIGRSAPAFYYNVPRVPFSPHFAQLIIETRSVSDNAELAAYVRRSLAPGLPDLELVTRKTGAGSAGTGTGRSAHQQQPHGPSQPDDHGGCRCAEGCGWNAGRAPRPGAGSTHPAVSDRRCRRRPLRHQPNRCGQSHLWPNPGLSIGELYSKEDPIPVVLRSSVGERLSVADLDAVDVPSRDGGVVPLAQVAHIETVWQPAAIRHRNGLRLTTVSSQLTDGVTFNQVLADLEPKLNALVLPGDVSISYGGDAEGSGEANSEMLRNLPIGLLLLLGVLLAEFSSFRRVAIILITVPLAAAGVVPGLLLGHQPFGFMSFLGVIALVGIVVNNAIVLLERIETRRKAGVELDEALRDAVGRRIRPILLTTATTVAGLLPLAYSSSTLWPPLASAMISGLLASTVLTLLVVPALYRLLLVSMKQLRPRWPQWSAKAP